MNPSEFCTMLTKIDNKENIPPGTSNSSTEQKDQPMHSMWRWLKQHVPFIQDTIIKFVTNRQRVNSSKFWEIDGDTYVIEHDYINTFIAKCTFYQAMFLSPTQIPVILVRVPSSDEQLKLLFRITTLVAKFEDLSPCIFHVQIHPETAPAPPSCSMYAQKELVTLILINAPLLPKTVTIKFRELLVSIEAIKERTQTASSCAKQQVESYSFYVNILLFITG